MWLKVDMADTGITQTEPGMSLQCTDSLESMSGSLFGDFILKVGYWLHAYSSNVLLFSPVMLWFVAFPQHFILYVLDE